MPPKITLTDAEDDAFRKLLGEGLKDYNDAAIGRHDRQPLAIRVCDPETGEPIGGLAGRTSLGVLFIDTVYLPKSLRGTGVGSRILAMAEDAVGLERIKTLIDLERIGVDLGLEADAAPFLEQVDKNPAFFIKTCDAVFQLVAAVTALRTEDITGDAG